MDVDADFSGAELLALGGAGVTAIAAFLPWVTAGVEAGPVDVSASATGIEGLGVITLILAVVVVAAVVALDWDSRGTFVVAVAGLVVVIVGLGEILDLEGAASPGIGLYLTVLGGIAALAAGAWGHRTESTDATAGTAR